MADISRYPWLPPDAYGVAAQLGAHANWDKFMQEASRSQNVEDYRRENPVINLIRSLGLQALYNSQETSDAMQSLHPFLSHHDILPPEITSDPLAIQAGYNSLAPDLPFLDNVRRNIAGPKLVGGFDPIEIDPKKAAELNARLRVNEMKPKGPLPMETDEFLRQRRIDEMLKGE